MAPKGKADDWEAELGESIAPPDNADSTANGANGANDDEPGGLMNLMRKSKQKRKRKGQIEDLGEDGDQSNANPSDLTEKPSDEPILGTKAVGTKQQQVQNDVSEDVNDGGESGKILTKAEKEKLKKQRYKRA